jgi:hypothetical protein
MEMAHNCIQCLALYLHALATIKDLLSDNFHNWLLRNNLLFNRESVAQLVTPSKKTNAIGQNEIWIKPIISPLSLYGPAALWTLAAFSVS